MTEKQALAKAKKLWGRNAYVFDRETLKESCWMKHVGRYYVGCPRVIGPFPYGNGNTWEEAFENAAKH